MSINGCLLAFVLGCNVTAEIIKEVEEGQLVTLRCPHSVEGKLTWSREMNGNKSDILMIVGDRDMRPNDPGKRYNSLSDGSLNIRKVAASDAGKYFCNNEIAVELRVIPRGKKTTSPTTRPPPAPPSPTTRPTATTTSTVATALPTVTNTANQQVHLGLAIGKVFPFLLLVILLVIIFVCFTWGRRSKRRENEERQPVYEEIQEGSAHQPSKGGSNQNDPTYSTIQDLAPPATWTEMFQPSESPHFLIGNTSLDGNQKGSSHPTDQTYFLLEKPKAAGNINDQHALLYL
ncbi:uncharacterized protein LOC120786068 isoform X1 [Xiphias gladius]|uniref:uncharacterized protein LOC120786068 isoform X1 n=1 Tax=Xiphias gladius TaxID=8245 RepID=UPI001A98E8BA|nr:uncharacterized protein LOC120786068 isoform X1 [Xiphias gladius]